MMHVRRLVMAALVAVCVASLQPPTRAQENDPTTVPRVTVEEFKAQLAKRTILAIDVRDPHSFESGHIPGSKNVSFVDVEIRANGLRRQPLPLVAYCA